MMFSVACFSGEFFHSSLEPRRAVSGHFSHNAFMCVSENVFRVTESRPLSRKTHREKVGRSGLGGGGHDPGGRPVVCPETGLASACSVFVRHLSCNGSSAAAENFGHLVPPSAEQMRPSSSRKTKYLSVCIPWYRGRKSARTQCRIEPSAPALKYPEQRSGRRRRRRR